MTYWPVMWPSVVDEGSLVVLAAEVTNQAADVSALISMIEVTEGNLDTTDIDDSPTVILADASYCSAANLDWITDSGHDVLGATGRIEASERVAASPRGRIPSDATWREAWRGGSGPRPDVPTTPDARPSWNLPSGR